MPNIVTPVGTLHFADGLFKKKPRSQGSDKLAYSAILLFDNTALQTPAMAAFKAACQQAVIEKFGAAKAADPAFVRTLRLPFKNAAEKSYGGFDKGELYISPWSEQKPGIVDIHGNEMPAAEADVWSGQLARMTVNVKAYDNNGNKGVTAYLEHVQIVKTDMPRQDGRQSATSAFKNADANELAAYGVSSGAAPSSGSPGTGMPW